MNNGKQTNGDTQLRVEDIEPSFKKKGTTTKLEKYLISFCVVVLAVCIVFVVLYVSETREKSSNSAGESGALTSDNICLTPECSIAASRLLSSLNTKVEPCNDFYEFACGTWMKKNVIPEDRSSYDKFGVVREDVEVIMKIVLEAPSAADDPVSVTHARNLYHSCINQSYIDSRGIEPTFGLLKELGGWPVLGTNRGGHWNESEYDLTTLLFNLFRYNNKPLIDLYVYTDSKNSSKRIIFLDQPSFGMPGRKYYLNGLNDPMVRAYKTLATTVAGEFHADPVTADNEMEDVVRLETEIANISMRDEDRRDSFALYNPIEMQKLNENYTVPADASFNWENFITRVMAIEGVDVYIPQNETIIVRAIPYFSKMFEVLGKYSKRTVANYLVWRIMKNRINNLSQKFQDLVTEYNKALFGTSTPRARWRTCASYVNNYYGLSLGRLFVKEAFDESAKEQTLDMIHNLRTAFGELVDENKWMDDATRTLAKEKAKFVQEKIGYQDFILNTTALDGYYENYTAKADTYFENVLSNLRRSTIDSLRYLRFDVDKNDWGTAPATVNAYYNSVLNRIMFPAGILQPPFFSSTQSKSMNYGGIGVVIGHELTHGFDDRGRQYDKDGNLKQWWTDEVIRAFKNQTQCLVDQYGDFSVPEADGMKMNGINTLGENIADNGGLKESYRVWCGNMRRESAINRILTGVHSPGRFRVIGTLQNSAGFSRAFNCPATSFMNPVKKCSVW
ncbi:neprilysin-like isoform X2 [Ostrea edulis]|uniref:neprilysin-like isoform X2 n=1 Tax=Ostrea edulis TaxID=37623 RepID=UPI0024AF2430|nr:neprilysin-like isoform X2 [Ostrea edulis]